MEVSFAIVKPCVCEEPYLHYKVPVELNKTADRAVSKTKHSEGGPALIATRVHLLIIVKWSKMVPCSLLH